MQLIGMLDSPYVRRVAISLRVLGVPFEHRSLSVFRDYDTVAAINPVVKVPTLVTDEGVVLMDSTLILDHVESVAGRSLMPAEGPERVRALRLLGVALAGYEKSVQLVYERNLRPAEKQHEPWVDRVSGQLFAALDLLEHEAEAARPWLVGERMLQPDITVAVAWRWVQHALKDVVEASRYPALTLFGERLEVLPDFMAFDF